MSAFLHGMDVEMLASDKKTLLATERLFQRITEAVIQIGVNDMNQIAAEVPLKQIRDFGNRLRHDYRNIDPVILLRTTQEHLPALRRAADEALKA